MTTILVTGATGTIGSQVVQALSAAEHVKAGVKVRAAVRAATEAQGLAKGNVTPVDFDYEKPETITAALAGVDRLFVLTPMVERQDVLMVRLVDAAKAAGLKRIVKLSAFGADAEPGITLGRAHRAGEKHIAASGIAWTVLRPNNFFENFINFYGPQKDGNIYLPWGQAAASFIAAADVGAVAAVTLTTDGPAHEGKAYDLTGPEAITVAQAARAIAEVTGRTIAYVDVPEEAARKAMAGAPAWMTDQLLELHGVVKAGYSARVTDAVPKLLGRPATSFLAFAKAHAAAWKG